MDLFDNALSSLKQGLKCLKLAELGDTEQYKFAVQHISHYAEIALKHAVYFMHPLLVFKKPYSKNLSNETTITPQEALYIIKNTTETDSYEEAELSKDDFELLSVFKKIRNSIEHYSFELSPSEVKIDIMFILEVIDSILVDICKSPISEALEGQEFTTYCELMETLEEI